MSVSRLVGLSMAVVLSFGIGIAVAQDAMTADETMTPEESVSARKDIMRLNGMTMRGIGDLTGDEAVAAMTTMKDNFETIPLRFPEGSIVGETRALPAIWENWEAFIAITETGVAAADAGIAAAEAGDAVAYAEAVSAIGATCGQCHQQFRGE